MATDDVEAFPTRKVEVQFQRWRPQTLTQVVEVPSNWTDPMIRKVLAGIYAEADQDHGDWVNQDDFDYREGEHELTGDASETAKVDMVFPPEYEHGDAP
jgi:hypothetical protein